MPTPHVLQTFPVEKSLDAARKSACATKTTKPYTMVFPEIQMGNTLTFKFETRLLAFVLLGANCFA